MRIPLLKSGIAQAGGAVTTATTSALLVIGWATDHRDVAGRLALAGLILFGLTLALGSARLVGLATLPMLGAALVAADGRASIGSIVVGCLWYVTLELAWDSIERRDGGERTAAYAHRRVFEVTTVVTLTLAVGHRRLPRHGRGARSHPVHPGPDRRRPPDRAGAGDPTPGVR